MSKAIIKNAAYCLIHTPDMIINQGTTQTTEKIVNPESEYLKVIEKHLRTYEEVVNYAPNQTYIGNMHPDDLAKIDMPYVGKDVKGTRHGKFGEILPQIEFLGLIKICDVFDLVLLEEEFANEVKKSYSQNPICVESDLEKLVGVEQTVINEAIKLHAEALVYDGKVVGCVKAAHDVDLNLTSHVIFENLVVKASGVHALRHLFIKNQIDPNTIDYVIECSEEACGDMNQRGGGNFAKAIAEMCGCNNATGSDLRGFCAAPTHALISAASLVAAKTFKNVVVVAGGATAKLGMNGKDHVKKELPILEDVLGSFAFLVSENDGVSPIIRNDIVGRHNVGTGSAPQAVITSLVKTPLEKAGLKLTDIDKYSVEMQNPDITKPAGAGDVAEANYKMIAALAVMGNEIERSQINDFIEKHGMRSWAPTQGHIPSGVPYLGFAIEDMTTGTVNRAQIIGKGSLFLGRMTNLFDGVSVVLERNNGEVEEQGNKEQINLLIAKALRNFATNLLEDEHE